MRVACHMHDEACVLRGLNGEQHLQLSIVFYYRILYTNMEGLRKLRGMAVFPAEETTRGYFCYLLLLN